METKLIEKAMKLTWKTLEDISDIDTYQKWKEYSIEKFFYYLISRKFQEAVLKVAYSFPDDTKSNFIHWFLHKITLWMVEYQEGNEEPIISLLEKI